MIKIKYTKQSFEEVLEQAFSELEAEDIHNLLLEAKEYFNQEQFKDDMIKSICNTVVKNRDISFKQWKAISAYVSKSKRKTQNKTF